MKLNRQGIHRRLNFLLIQIGGFDREYFIKKYSTKLNVDINIFRKICRYCGIHAYHDYIAHEDFILSIINKDPKDLDLMISKMIDAKEAKMDALLKMYSSANASERMKNLFMGVRC